MSRESEKLFEALGEVRDEFVDEAVQTKFRKKRPVWLRFGAVAAALGVAVGVGAYALPRLGMGGTSAPNAATGGSGSDGGSVFMSYEGPVFPLTLAEENDAVTAERTLTLDFAPWEPVWVSNEAQLDQARSYGATEEELLAHAADLERWYPEGGYYDKGTDLRVRDEYVLTNSTDEEQVVGILYPYASALRYHRAEAPTLTADGAELDTELVAGDYVGGFRGAGGENDGRLNLDQPDSWEDYQTALSGGGYLSTALDEFPDLSGVPVILYTFTEPWSETEEENVSVQVRFDVDGERTKLLSLNFHMGWSDDGNGRQALGFDIPPEWRKDHGQPYYFLVVGKDLQDVEIGGIVWEDGEEKPVQAGVTVTREETDLDTALRLAARELYEDDWMFGEAIEADFELYYGLLCEYLLDYGALAEDPAERYDNGWLQSVDFEIVERVFYAKTTVTLPANGSVTVTAELTKHASFDYACTGSENVGVSGYDAVTTLGSDLTFTAQSARLEDRGLIDIVRENFGFDLETGATEVELDLDREHYYIEVRRK